MLRKIQAAGMAVLKCNLEEKQIILILIYLMTHPSQEAGLSENHFLAVTLIAPQSCSPQDFSKYQSFYFFRYLYLLIYHILDLFGEVIPSESQHLPPYLLSWQLNLLFYTYIKSSCLETASLVAKTDRYTGFCFSSCNRSRRNK